MKINFRYDAEKDTWCLKTKGPSSNNSAKPTKTYLQLTKKHGPHPSDAQIASFIKQEIETNYDIDSVLQSWDSHWKTIEHAYHHAAERVFRTSINRDLTGYATVNTRCPYNLKEGWFFIALSQANPSPIIMHELWHFYTWEQFGATEHDRIGARNYNTIKESLTVLLNIECANLFPHDQKDLGYPQHLELRKRITEWWHTKPDIQYIWERASRFTEASTEV